MPPPFSLPPSRLGLSLALFLHLLQCTLSHPCEGIQSYLVTFEYNWSPETDVSFPTGDNTKAPGFSPLLCASHSPDYVLWEQNSVISPAVRTLLTNVSNERIEDELEQAKRQKKVLQYLSVSKENTTADSAAFLVISVDASCNFTRISCIAKVIPSPDWFIGLPSIDMCRNGSFRQKREGKLFGWDGGIDNSEAYDESLPLPTSEAVPVLPAFLASPDGFGDAIIKQTQVPIPSPSATEPGTDGNDKSRTPNAFVPDQVASFTGVTQVQQETVCIDATALRHFPANALLYAEHRLARVLCDPYASCATPGHMVSFRGVPMMMKSYCHLTSCTQKLTYVNSPRYSPALRIPSKSPHLQFTALAARFATAIEEYIMSTALRIGL